MPLYAEAFGDRAELIDDSGDLRTTPAHGMDGFYAVRLRRAAE
ncbi:MAG: hypothetical protein O9277_00730 [Magnetospirillum sp.]|nr:hypothetical protein [Magnetospirillum sp.]